MERRPVCQHDGERSKDELRGRQTKHGAVWIILDLQLGSTKEVLSGKVCDHIY